jgi:hypothetical protein
MKDLATAVMLIGIAASMATCSILHTKEESACIREIYQKCLEKDKDTAENCAKLSHDLCAGIS